MSGDRDYVNDKIEGDGVFESDEERMRELTNAINAIHRERMSFDEEQLDEHRECRREIERLEEQGDDLEEAITIMQREKKKYGCVKLEWRGVIGS